MMIDEVYFPNEIWTNIKAFAIPDEDESETRDRLDVFEVCGIRWRGCRLTMCMAGGGSHWWNYVLYYTDDECSYDLFLESKDGMVRLYGRKLIYSLEDPGIEYVKEVCRDFEPKYSSNIYYCDPEDRQECTIESDTDDDDDYQECVSESDTYDSDTEYQECTVTPMIKSDTD